ncbi:MAG: hypothetical protein WBF40_01235 [Methyloceanibacter sp.]|jgi:hypothetical protein
MLTRVLLVLVLVAGFATGFSDAKIVAIGLADHEVTQVELEKGEKLAVPRFDTGGIAYVLAANLKQGDTVEISLNLGDKSLLHNTQELSQDQPSLLLQAGKRGVPAGGWPEGTYHAEAKIMRDGKPLISGTSTPMAFD